MDQIAVKVSQIGGFITWAKALRSFLAYKK